MSQGAEDKKLTIGDFKNQVGLMVKAISYFSSSDRTEAFGYLQNCIKNLEPCNENVELKENDNEISESHINEAVSEELKSTIRDLASESENDNCDLLHSIGEDKKTKEVKECESKCLICGLTFLDLKQLYSHGIKEHPGNLESCEKCNETFSNSQIYEIHLSLGSCSSQRKRSESLLCPYCAKQYHNFQHYSLHIEGHKRNKCEECGIHYNNRKILEEHSWNVHKRELRKDPFECKFCDRKFAQKRSVLKHYKLMHSKENIICFTCGKIFENDNDLKSHEKTHLDNSFLCNNCGERFSRKQQYLTHLKEHDKYQCLTCRTSSSNKMKLEKHERAGHVIKGLPTDHHCPICGSSFHFQSSLIFHKKMHSVSSEESYGCEPCQRIFKKYAIYREHLLTEQHFLSVKSAEVSEQMPCKYCSKVFSNKRLFFKHLNKYHLKGKQVFHCDICDFKTNVESCLHKHKKLHTKKKEFICEKCGDSFYTKNALSDHINYVHNEERNFSCEKCGQTFKSSSVLNRHMLCHNKEKTYECHCGQSYKFVGNLNRHQLLVHGKTTKSKRVKRLISDEVANLTSKPSKNKKKQEMKEKQHTNNTATIYALIDPQGGVSLPLEHIIAQGNLLLSGGQPESHILQSACHNLNYSVENRSQLVLSQNLDIVALREVDNLLQSEDSLKTTDTNETVDSATQNIFDRHLSDTDGSAFLDGESLIHPPIEPSLVTSLDDSSLNSVDRLETDPDQSNSQPQLLPGPYYNIHFLDI